MVNASKHRVTGLSPEARNDIRAAVKLAVRYWPNAHLGDQSPREDIRCAFSTIRLHAKWGTVSEGVIAVEADAYRHADM